MKEKWKDIEGFPNYQVSSLGRVRSLDWKIDTVNKFGTPIKRTREGKILSPNKDGHVILSKNGSNFCRSANKLKKTTFDNYEPKGKKHRKRNILQF